MKKIISLSLILTFPQIGLAQKTAEKCIDQFINLSVAAKTRAILNQTANSMVQNEHQEGQTEESAKKRIDQLMLDPKTCSKMHDPQTFHDYYRSTIRSKSVLLAEFSRKKKVDATQYWMINNDNGKNEISEADICDDFRKEVDTLAPCDPDRYMLADSSHPVAESLSLEDSCKKLQAKIVANEKKARDCEKQAEEKKEKERQPKAEISPDVPAKAPSTYTPSSSSSSFLREQNRQNPTRSKDQKPSAGGSGQ